MKNTFLKSKIDREIFFELLKNPPKANDYLISGMKEFNNSEIDHEFKGKIILKEDLITNKTSCT